MISWDFFSVANNLGDSVAFNLESDIAKRLAEIETTLLTHDAALRELYETIRPLLMPPEEPSRRQIGFGPRLLMHFIDI
jgi:hypothetical protein